MAYLKEFMDESIPQKDVSREGLTFEKVLQLGRLFRPSFNNAIAKVSKFSVIDIKRINELLRTNFKGVILDIDECVAPHHGEVLPENMDAIIKMVQQGVKIVIFSNMEATDRYDSLIEKVRSETGYEIKIIMSSFPKPDKRGFQECIDNLGLEKDEKIVAIGDNPVTDGGAILAGIPFIRVKPMKTQEKPSQKAKRIFQTGSRGFYNAQNQGRNYFKN